MRAIVYKCMMFFALVIAATAQASTPDIKHWQTSQGLMVYFIATEDLPMLDLQMVFDAGSARDGGQPGLARLSSYMLGQGAAGLSADALAVAFDDVGAVFASGSYRDMATVSLRTLSDEQYAAPAIDTWLKVLTQPDFPKRDLRRAKDQFRVALASREADPGTLAQEALFNALYGDHPYAHPIRGNPASIGAIKAKDLRAFHQQYYVTRNATLAMVGNLGEAEARALAERIAAALPQGAPATDMPAVAALTHSQQISQPFPSEQAHVYLATRGASRDDADYFSLLVGNHILGGGGFSSRLMTQVREQKGLVYSIGSGFSFMQRPGPFMVSLQTRGDQLEQALGITREVVGDFVENGPTPIEVEAAKQNLLGSFPMRIAGNGNLVQTLASMGFYGLPLDYLHTWQSRVAAVSGESVREAFARHIDPDKLITVVVGGEGKNKN